MGLVNPNQPIVAAVGPSRGRMTPKVIIPKLLQVTLSALRQLSLHTVENCIQPVEDPRLCAFYGILEIALESHVWSRTPSHACNSKQDGP
jgi:hypothetical protein